MGTIPSEPYAGNNPPMLGRLPHLRALVVNKGFKNNGVGKVLKRVDKEARQMPLGVSIGVTNKSFPNFNAQLDDLVAGFRQAEKFNNFDYYELNISCPNLINAEKIGHGLNSPEGLRLAFARLGELSLTHPVFIKMPLDNAKMEELITVASQTKFICGLIFSNLAKTTAMGNISGKPVQEKSNEWLARAYKLHGDRFILIGVGGVFTAEDAYKKILLGASLIQLITGMVYMGPQLIGQINKSLTKLLTHDGYKNIREAIGKGIKY